ncbi:MAG: hypothetical protein WC389_19895 [Lutibacter sp.]|jgi:hypothetical protein
MIGQFQIWQVPEDRPATNAEIKQLCKDKHYGFAIYQRYERPGHIELALSNPDFEIREAPKD